MAPTIPFSVPPRVTAGDSWSWRQSYAEYPISDGWELSYGINGKEAISWDSGWITNDGSEFTVAIPPASTTVGAGRYRWSAILTGSGAYAGKRFTVESGTLVVDPDPATMGEDEGQPHAEKMLAIIEALIAGTMPAGVQAYSIGGRSVTLMSDLELRRWRGYYRSELYHLRNPGRGLPRAVAAFTVVR